MSIEPDIRTIPANDHAEHLPDRAPHEKKRIVRPIIRSYYVAAQVAAICDGKIWRRLSSEERYTYYSTAKASYVQRAEAVQRYQNWFYLTAAQEAVAKKGRDWNKLSPLRQRALVEIQRRIGDQMGVPYIASEALQPWYDPPKSTETNVGNIRPAEKDTTVCSAKIAHTALSS